MVEIVANIVDMYPFRRRSDPAGRYARARARAATAARGRGAERLSTQPAPSRSRLGLDFVEFLLLKRAPGDVIGGTWQSVHGKIEPGETAPQAALRELLEETRLKPLRCWQLEYVNTFYVARVDRILMCPGFTAEVALDAAVTLSDEHTDFRWEPSEQALKSYIWPGQRRAVREILEEIVTPGRAEPHLRIPIPD